MKQHVLKSWPENFQPVLSLAKKCELRLNDRDYQVGDEIILREWIPEGRELHDAKGIRLSVGEYSGDWIRLVISHITNVGETIGPIAHSHINEGLKMWVVLSFDFGFNFVAVK